MRRRPSHIDQTMEQAREALTHCTVTPSARMPPAAPVDVWVAASGLQKGIRRGDAQAALACAMTLLLHDPDRLWRRLSGIAIEDIGIAGLTTATQVIAVS